MRNAIPPETEEQLRVWNTARLGIVDTQEEIKILEERIKCRRDQMDDVARRLENILFNLERPIGLKIDDDYVVAIRDPYNDNFVIQTINFDLRREITDS